MFSVSTNCDISFCRKNGENFKEAWSTSNYTKEHSDFILFKCTLCPFETIYEHNIQSHVKENHKFVISTDKTHVAVSRSRDSLLNCNICSYSTNNSKNLKRHQVIHDDSLKTYKCETCLYTTKEKSRYEKHLTIHDDSVELLKCAECSYQTKHRRYMKYHMINHDDSIPTLKCDKCKYKTKNKSCLKTTCRK